LCCFCDVGGCLFFCLSAREEASQILNIKITIDQINGRVPVIAGISSPSLRLAVNWGKYAEDVGADATMAILPAYFPVTNKEIYAYFETLSNGINLPLFLYHFPAITFEIKANIREKTGKGQLVDTSLMGSLMCAESLVLSAPAILNQEFPREIRAEAGNPIYNHYKAKDDKWFILAHLQPDRYWPNVCRALGMPELEHDPKFNSIEARGVNRKDLISIMDKEFATKTRDEWFDIFKKEGLIYTPIQTPTEVVNDEQALANNYVVWYDHPALGKTKMVGFPWNFSDTPATIRREPPELGQHTEEVLLEHGYTAEDISKFKDEKVIL